MLWNDLTVALRNLLRYRVYAAVNVAGLAIGVACCLLILLLVRNELSFDRFQERADRIYRVIAATESRRQAMTPGPLGPVLAAEYPEVERIARIGFRSGKALVRRGDRAFYEEGWLYADAGFFGVFTYRFLRGDPNTALSAPNTVVLTERLAHKYFPDEDPLGQILHLEPGGRALDCTVTGVIEDPPEATSLPFDCLISARTSARWSGIEAWNNWNYETYLLLVDGTGALDLESRLPQLVAERWPSRTDGLRLKLQPLLDVHLDADVRFGIAPTGDPAYLYALASVALGILLIACVNAANLATALSAARVREIGARKVLGASRGQLVGQLWGEAFLVNALACALGAVLAELCLPLFERLTDRTLSLSWDGGSLVGVAAIAVAVSLASGLHPAAMLSRLEPCRILRGAAHVHSSSRLGRLLVAAQFTLAIGLVAVAAVMSQQVDLLTGQRLGFDQEQAVVVHAESVPDRGRVLPLFKQGVLALPGVAAASIISRSFGEPLESTSKDYEGRRVTFYRFFVDDDYLTTLGLSLLRGSGFGTQAASGTEPLIVNETALRVFGIEPGSAVGGEFHAEWWGDEQPLIVGVIADYNFRSLHHAVEPVVLHRRDDDGRHDRQVLVRVRAGDVGTLTALKAIWDDVAPGYPFDYSFLDDDIDRQYASEIQWQQIMRAAALLAVILACLGLLGMTSLAVTQRTREIGIRKAVGSTSTGIVTLFVGESGRLVVAAAALAAPLSYFGLRRWLQAFTYRVDLDPTTFLLSGAAVLAVALLTAGLQALRGAQTNPVDALRYE